METVKHIVDEETRKKLVGFLPFSEDATIEFTPSIFLAEKEDKTAMFPEEVKPVFTLSCMTTAQRTEFVRLNRGFDPKAMSAHESDQKNFQAKELLRVCVKGWRSFYDLGTLTEIVYESDKDGGASKELFRIIPEWIVTEMLIYVGKMSSLMPGDKAALK